MFKNLDLDKKVVNGNLEFIVLSLINMKTQHGYGVVQEIKAKFGVSVGVSTIYPLLTKLKKKGYVEVTFDVSTVRPRKVFSITKEGKLYINNYLAEINTLIQSMINTSFVTV